MALASPGFVGFNLVSAEVEKAAGKTSSHLRGLVQRFSGLRGREFQSLAADLHRDSRQWIEGENTSNIVCETSAVKENQVLNPEGKPASRWSWAGLVEQIPF